MNDTQQSGGDWSDAVSRASEHVQEREHAIEEAEERQKPKSGGPLLAALAVVLVGVLVWDVYAFTRVPETLPVSEEVVDLRLAVADLVDAVEDFRAQNGRLPSRGDLGDLVDEEFTYRVDGDEFVVGLEGEGASVEYRSSMPLTEWLAAGDAPGASE